MNPSPRTWIRPLPTTHMPSSHPLPATPALTSQPPKDTVLLLCKLHCLQPRRPLRFPGHRGGASLLSGRRPPRKSSLPPLSPLQPLITSSYAITDTTFTSGGVEADRLSRPLWGTAQRPRFLCTLERVINLKWVESVSLRQAHKSWKITTSFQKPLHGLSFPSGSVKSLKL